MNTLLFGLLLTVIFMCLDICMIYFVFLKRWTNDVLSIQKSELEVNVSYASITSVLLICGMMIFIYPYLTDENYIRNGLILGFLWGFITYGVFDTTNLGIFKNYSPVTAFIDTCWGGIVVAVSVTLTYHLLK